MWARSSLIFYANCSLHVWESFLLFGNLYSFVLQENKAAGRTFTKHLTDVTAHQFSVQFVSPLSLSLEKEWVGYLEPASPYKRTKKKKIV